VYFPAGSPYFLQAQITDIATGESYCGQRRATFDGAVGLQRQTGLAGFASSPMNALVAKSAPNVFVGSEVANIIADRHQQPAIYACRVQPGQQWHQFQNPVRLQ
jgi:hypothetical protein